jgi:hypothetical protein
MSPWRLRALAPAAVYLLITLLWSWPLPLHLTNRFTHDPGDPLLVTYLMWWNAHAFPLSAAYWNPPFYVPMRDGLALTETLAGLSPVTTPLQWLGLSPLTTYNLALIASTWWSALATHAVVRRLGGSTLAAFCAGLAFAFAPYRTGQLGHLQLYACWWLPLMLLALHGYYMDRRARWLVLLGASWVLQGLTNGYFLLFAPVLIGIWLLWFTRRPTLGAAVRVIAALAVSAGVVLPFLLKYRAVQALHGFSRSRQEMAGFSATLGSFASASPMLRFWHTGEPPTTEQYLFPGVTALALTIAGIAIGRRDRRLWFYVCAAAFMALMCTGPAAGSRPIALLWHPYTWLAALPGYSGLRVPSRFFMFAALCLAVAAGLAFDAIRARSTGGWRPAVAVAVFAGLVVDGAIAGMPLGVPPPPLPIDERGARVIALPLLDGRVSVYTMYQSMSHRRPLVNGYAGYVPLYAAIVDWSLRRGDPSPLTELRRGHPLYVFIASSNEAEDWSGFMDTQPGAELLGIEGGGRLYRMPPAPFAREVRTGTPAADADVTAGPQGLVADLHQVRALRALELRTWGSFRMPHDLIVDVSSDGANWTTIVDERPGGLMMLGALATPLVVPIRVDLQDRPGRFVRINTPSQRASGLTVFVP